MARHAGQSTIIFSTAFFSWLERQNLLIEEHPYLGMDFRGDPYLILAVGAQWGAMGKLFDQKSFFIFSSFYMFFMLLMFPRLN